MSKTSNDLRLQPGSPAIDVGADVGLKTDYDGNPVPTGLAPDVGAEEFIGGNMAVTKTVNFILTVVDAPGIGVTLNPAVGQVQRGQSIAVQISISSIGGYAGAVTFAVSGLPTGAGVTFAPTSIVPGQTTTMTITTLATTPTGAATIAITATGA